jgi:hypothetical protein
MSAHPHEATRAGLHIDLRLGDPATGIAHSFVLPKADELPKPGEAKRVIPTYDHTLPYLDFTGRIESEYGKGVVRAGRREQADVYHADPTDPASTKLRFNLYGGTNPEEFAIRKDQKGRWFLHNKTQTREKRPDLPVGKPTYKETEVDKVDPDDPAQVMMPKLDGAHVLIDLKAGRSPRVFSYRVAKKAPTGLIEHTHKLPELLEKKVPKELDGLILRGELLGIDKDGKAIPAEVIGGLLNSKVWESRDKQKRDDIKLQVFPFSTVSRKGENLENAAYSDKLKVLEYVSKVLPALKVPEVARTPERKKQLLEEIGKGKHPLTTEGVVLVELDKPSTPIKAKYAPDHDVYIRDVHPAISGKTGEPHGRVGSVSYSWGPNGPIVGQFGGFKHDVAKDMLENPDKYVGRVAKVKAMKKFESGALFQPRFAGWHLDKGDLEKNAMWKSFEDELRKIAARTYGQDFLGEEALASIKGYKGLKATGASPEELLQAKKNLAKAFGTYALGAASDVIPAAAASRAKLKGLAR